MSTKAPAAVADSYDEVLCHLLAEHNATCRRCGYHLRGLKGTECPECGRGLEVRIGLVRPRGRAFAWGLLGLAAGAGLGALLLMYFLVMFWKSGWTPTWRVAVAVAVVALVIEGTLLVLWQRAGKRIRFLSPAARTALVSLAWSESAANVALFVALA